MEINVLIDEEFEKQLDAGWLRSLAEKVLSSESIGAGTEMGLVITTQEEVRELNRNYRGIDEPTDVLSFQMPPGTIIEAPAFFTPPDGIVHLGEVVISYPQAVAQAEEHRHSVQKEMTLLVVHGVLHLLGYDHEKPEEERRMRSRETEILSLGGLA